MNLVEMLLVFILGFFISIPSSMVGLAGGFLFVPLLILVFGLPAQNAAAVSLVAICGTTFSATVGYVRQRRVDYKLGLLYDILDIPGVILGALLTTVLSSDLLRGIYGFFILFISLLLIRSGGIISSADRKRERRSDERGWKRRITDSSGGTLFEYVVRSPGLALMSSFAGGVITGLAGLGGGITDTSTMILLGVPPLIAAASSEFAMAVTNGAGVVAHGFLQNILIEFALPMTMGTIIGAQIGCSLAKHVGGKTLRKTLALIAFFSGLRLILSLFLS
ncbi:sulfite exporter TauE/SafE family protein [Candidatus Bathyarchaeota archaeon]|nr:sulfite exporter TauE/SafE family protein [Candidatus Bathyarchaeota archaeon]